MANRLLKQHLGWDFEGVGKKWADQFLGCHSDALGTYWTRSMEAVRGQAVNPNTHAAWFISSKQNVENVAEPP